VEGPKKPRLIRRYGLLRDPGSRSDDMRSKDVRGQPHSERATGRAISILMNFNHIKNNILRGRFGGYTANHLPPV
jgi:hypothetical protein